jgi:LysR family transcriptional activator of nhaA
LLEIFQKMEVSVAILMPAPSLSPKAAVSLEAEWLNYHHLRYFWAVAKGGSIRAAAEQLRISQPSISAQIKMLEDELGEELFRRSGRMLVLTEFGRLVLGYAEEIFEVGQELLTAVRRGQGSQKRFQRLSLGILDSFPKLLAVDLVRPLFTKDAEVRLSCHEGKLDELLARLVTHRLDAILADEPAPAQASFKTFSHPCGVSGVTFCAAPAVVRAARGTFPANLEGLPALLPSPNTSLRRDLERWFTGLGIRPNIVAEFEDAALAQIFATEGLGFTVVPKVVAEDAVERYGYEVLGSTDDCQVHLYLITAERRLAHPAVVVLSEHARHLAKKARSRAV